MTSNEYMKLYMRDYSAKRRQKALDYLGGVCSSCGSIADLEIHHIDPATKSFTLGSGWHHSWAKLEAELKKCEILCEKCHKNEHKVNNPHGTARRYWQGCRCNACKAANAAHSAAYKQSKGV